MQPDFRQPGQSVHHFIRQPSAGLLLFEWFAGLILVGTVLLSLPFSHAAGGSVSVLDALFTSTSAVCVTGLTTVDTGTRFSLAGQWIILVLIQLGGLGILTFLALAFRALGVRMDLQSQAAVEDSLFQKNVAAQFADNFLRIIRVVLLVEAAGAVVLFVALLPGHTAGHSLYSAIFHSVAAFTHAGFSLYSDSLEGFRGNPVFLSAVMLLIFFGSLGMVVLGELASVVRNWRRRPDGPAPLHRFSLHARIVLQVSSVLVLVGTLLILAGGGLTGSPAAKVQDALFQSVSARSGGLSTVNVGALPLVSLLSLIVLMFIGGSPGSCAGGVKTTTLALWWARFRGAFRGSYRTMLGGRYIPEEIGRKVTLLLGLALTWNLLGLLVLSVTERAPLEQVLFEQVSAFGTVGLSTGLTPELSTAGKLWVILNMFLGRLGPITIALSTVKPDKSNIQYPEGRVMIG
ncbi:ATPase [Myxococcota bacterium]|nr:ATPase [Myxococcota bacterium]MBU1413243.1 ATPase [Myxococcota bacterium]MBU1511841.1 ATPase [Myxococcota bacterium]